MDRQIRKTCSGRLALGLLAVLTASCSAVGPMLLPAQRIDYNIAIQRSNDEQLLLNLVRLKYREAPYFLEVNSVSSQITYQRNINAGMRWNIFREDGPNLSDTESPNIGVTGIFAERPTVSYAPLRGDDYIRRLLSPISTDKILLLHRSGWDIDRVLRLTVQSLNGVKNAPSASGPTPLHTPEYSDFAGASMILPDLLHQDALRLTYEKSKLGPQLKLQVTPLGKQHEAVASLRKKLKLPDTFDHYILSPNAALPAEKQYVNVQTRSLMGMLFYLSQGIEIPPADIEAGRVTLTRGLAGETFDWAKVTGDLFRIRSSSQRPSDAAIAVRYRDHWYYIADTDLSSKSTFTLLSQIITLQAGKAKDNGPILTLPVGGG